MGQRRPQKLDLGEILPPLVGLMLMGVILIPGVKQWLDSWFVWAACLLSFAVVALILRALWRRPPAKEREPEQAPVLSRMYIHSDAERAQFRAMCGVTERPEKPMKVVTPETDDDAKQSTDSADKP